MALRNAVNANSLCWSELFSIMKGNTTHYYSHSENIWQQTTVIKCRKWAELHCANIKSEIIFFALLCTLWLTIQIIIIAQVNILKSHLEMNSFHTVYLTANDFWQRLGLFYVIYMWKCLNYSMTTAMHKCHNNR